MKKCPFCAEEIQDEAIKCRYCGDFIMERKPKVKWYFKTHALLIAFMTVGPFALPLVWLHPNLSQKAKIAISVIVGILSLLVMKMMSEFTKTIGSYYQLGF